LFTVTLITKQIYFNSPCLQIFNLLALWASKCVILLARTQFTRVDQKKKQKSCTIMHVWYQKCWYSLEKKTKITNVSGRQHSWCKFIKMAVKLILVYRYSQLDHDHDGPWNIYFKFSRISWKCLFFSHDPVLFNVQLNISHLDINDNSCNLDASSLFL
jgi:hypothetical protein